MESRHGHKISETSGDTMDKTLDLFASEDTLGSVISNREETIRPTRENFDTDCEVRIPKNETLYTALRESYMLVEVNVENDAGNAVNASVWPGDNFVHLLWASMVLLVNGKIVENPSNYTLSSSVKRLVEESYVQKLRGGAISGWFEDDGLCLDGNTAKDKPAITARKTKIAAKKSMFLKFQPDLQFLKQDKVLPPGTEIILKMRRSDAKISLMNNDNAPAGGAKVKVKSVEWKVKRLQINEAIQAAHASVLVNGNSYKYPYTRVADQTHNIAQGLKSANITCKTSGQIPDQLYVGLISHSATSGEYHKNPIRFHHYDIEKIDCKVNGVSDGNIVEVETESGDYTRAYGMLKKAGDMSGVENGISYDQFQNGVTLFCYDLTSDGCIEGAHLIKSGSLTIHLQFRNALPENIICYVYEKTVEELSINYEGQVEMIGGV